MKNTLITDTGYWYALLNKNDHYHQRAVEYTSVCTDKLITTWPVITETCYMLYSRCSIREARIFLDLCAAEMFSIFQLEKEYMLRASWLMQKYADLPMDLADASMVILAEELGHGRILSTDQRDFHTYRWKNHQPFENLLLMDS
ncbi:MAG: PIN domain-containing protein [Gammaproteobacteria bacterium]|nr:PIN domain-containing protein [Gammaproteobacteria bacterium]